MTFGEPIFAAWRTRPASINTIDPTKAMAETLGQYLKCSTFRVWGKDAPDKDFVLEDVATKWPEPGSALPYPCASIVEQTDTFHAEQFRPFPLEDSRGVFDCFVVPTPDPLNPKTILWRTGEAAVEFQVDFWTSNEPDRDAIAARLSFLFNPGQERTGVLLEGHPRYYARSVRATLLSHRRPDNQESVFPNERRLQCAVRCEVDIVDLRIAVSLSTRVAVNAIDPADPGAQP